MFLISCGKENKEKPNRESVSLGITQSDSMSIYEAIRERELNNSEKKKEVIKFLDSLQEYDVDKYEILYKEIEDRSWQ